MRTNARVDRNQPEIVDQLRRCGCSVLIISQLKNCFDILVGFKGSNFAFEIKDGTKPPSGQKLTTGEKAFFDTWKGQVDVITCVEDAFKIIDKKIAENLEKS